MVPLVLGLPYHFTEVSIKLGNPSMMAALLSADQVLQCLLICFRSKAWTDTLIISLHYTCITCLVVLSQHFWFSILPLR
jgi:hypothetical protein